MAVKQTKKQSWIKENWFGLLGAVLLISLVATIIHTKSTSYICSKNPEKCVCEYTTTQGIQIPAKTELCDGRGGDYNFRLKTKSELDIDDCNNNPREDEKCKCVKNSTILDGCYPEPQSIKCIKSRPKTECEKGNPDWVEEIGCCVDLVGNGCKDIKCVSNKTICREKTR